MHIDAMLCNHAEAVQNLLYVSGGGVNVVQFQPGAMPPYGASLGLAIQVTVPWTRTNQQHRVRVEIIGEDGEAVHVPTGPDTVEPFTMEMAFNVGRPAGMHPGDDQTIALAANLAGIPFPAAGKFEFVIRIDGDPDPRRLPVRVIPAQGGQLTFQ